MAYNFWQGFPQVTLGPVEYFPLRKLSFNNGDWSAWRRAERWILDFGIIDGMQIGVRIDGRETSHMRPTRTWHLYAPGTYYHERFTNSAAIREDMWMFLTFRRPWPPLSRRKFSVLHDPEERICQYVRAMYAIQQTNQHSGSHLTLYGLLMAVLGEIAAAARRGGEGTPEKPWSVAQPERSASGGESLLLQLDSAILRKLDRQLSLDELADSLQMSVSSLGHRFKAQTGMTVVQRQRWLKVREARRLLNLPGASVKSVAQQLGFGSPFYFSKVFSEMTGLPPQEYMKRRSAGK